MYYASAYKYIHICINERIHIHIFASVHTYMHTKAYFHANMYKYMFTACLPLCSEDREAATWSQTNMVMQGDGGTMGCAHPVWAWDQYNVALCAAVTLALQVYFLVYALPSSSPGRHHSIGTDSQYRSLGRAHFSSSQPRYSSTR